MPTVAPVYNPGHTLTLTASATVTGGQLLAVSGSGSVAPAGAASTGCVGMAAFDAAVGQRVTVYAGGVQPLTAAATITAGALLKAAVGGQVTNWDSGSDDRASIVGSALTSASIGNDVRVVMQR